ncbi:DUF4242 domain-containing protein [Candidatus Wolfebacteria bacterium]|nr:DUF4242 domain-containing protein [Candidatus Wolfebacteria bacterium]
MALFLGVHDLNKDMGDGWAGYKKACEELGCHALHAYSNDEKKVGYCVTEASSADGVRKAHENADISLEDVFEVNRSE